MCLFTAAALQFRVDGVSDNRRTHDVGLFVSVEFAMCRCLEN